MRCALERRLAVFHVVGGIYTDTSFTKLEPGQAPVRLGPFRTYHEARGPWRDLAARTIDICCARYWIEGPEDARRE
jgi:hypothetical protein